MLTFMFLVTAGLVAGAINAVAGGGAILLFPVLLSLGVEPIPATATISIAVLPGLIGALVGYRKDLREVRPVFLLLIFPVIIGASAGAYALTTINTDLFAAIIPWLVLSAVILLAFQSRIHHIIVTDKHLVKTNRRLGWLTIVAAISSLSIYGGFFGVGVGLMLLAVIGLSSKLKSAYQLNALKNWYVAGIATVAFIIFMSQGLIRLEYGLVLAAGTLIGGYVGAKLSRQISSYAVHNITVALGVIIVVYLFLK